MSDGLGDRLDAWVDEHGGQDYVRKLVANARQLELERVAREARRQEYAALYDAVLQSVKEASADQRQTHGQDWAGLETSLAKRIAGRLWAMLRPAEDKQPAESRTP